MVEKTILEPANDLVLIVDSPRTTTLDGITLPDNVKQQEMVYGTVIFVGPLVSKKTKPESMVAYGPYAGKTAVIEGIEFRLLHEEQIEGYLRKVKVQD